MVGNNLAQLNILTLQFCTARVRLFEAVPNSKGGNHWVFWFGKQVLLWKHWSKKSRGSVVRSMQGLLTELEKAATEEEKIKILVSSWLLCRSILQHRLMSLHFKLSAQDPRSALHQAIDHANQAASARAKLPAAEAITVSCSHCEISHTGFSNIRVGTGYNSIICRSTGLNGCLRLWVTLNFHIASWLSMDGTVALACSCCVLAGPKCVLLVDQCMYYL